MDDVVTIEGRLAAMEAEITALRAQLAERDSGPVPPEPAVGVRRLDEPAPPDATTEPDTRTTSRRRLLLGGAAATAAAVAAASVTGAQPAAAATGTMQYGASNDATTSPTLLTSTASNTLKITNPGDGLGLNVVTVSSEGIRSHSEAGIGVWGISGGDNGIVGESGSAYGIYGHSDTNDGGYLASNEGAALQLSDGRAHIRFTGTHAAPPSTSITHPFADLVVDDARDMWLCIASGTPGTWRKIGGGTTAGALHVLPAPVRVYDSRVGTAPSQGPKTKLSGNVARTIDLKVNSSGVPAGATAALLTVLLVDAANANGNMTVWANGVARPSANTMVWGGPAARFTTSTITSLDASAQCQVSASVSTNLVLDVVGYYR